MTARPWRTSIGLLLLVLCLGLPASTLADDLDPAAAVARQASAGEMPAVRGQQVALAHPAFPGPVEVTIGHSVEGRPIVASHRKGSLHTDRVVVIFGVIHGDERSGRMVTDALHTVPLPPDLDLWIVPSLNPDGEVRGSHQNAHGVDLNRNWPANWESGTTQSSGRHWSGSAPGSEPETAAGMAFLAYVDPDVSVWYHSPWDTIDCNQDRAGPFCVDFAARVQRSVTFSPRPGTATDWTMTSGFGASFVVEFGGVRPDTATVDRHVAAILALGT